MCLNVVSTKAVSAGYLPVTRPKLEWKLFESSLVPTNNPWELVGELQNYDGKESGFAVDQVSAPPPAVANDDYVEPRPLGVLVGLSMSPYLSATVIDASVKVVARPGSLRLAIKDARTAGAVVNSGRYGDSRPRGKIKEFSFRSRMNLNRAAHDLEGADKTPDYMITLTYSGDWQRVAPSGRRVKRHLEAFRRRLERYTAKMGIVWSALWFLEFQKRGAPHFHFLVFGLDESVKLADSFRSWLSKSWAEVVNHPDPVEYKKHLAAGTKVEKCRKRHFGYAKKYASKLEQKVVPAEFQDVGRFWGIWHSPELWKVEFSEALTIEKLKASVYAALDTVAPYANKFASVQRSVFDTFCENGGFFAVTIFGRAGRDAYFASG
jgi:hypothetical protein